MLKSLTLRLFAIMLVLSGTSVPPATAEPRRGDFFWDLVLEVDAAPDPVTSGGQVTLTFTARNDGQDPANPTLINTSTPEGTTFASAQISSGDVVAPQPGGTGEIQGIVED